MYGRDFPLHFVRLFDWYEVMSNYDCLEEGLEGLRRVLTEHPQLKEHPEVMEPLEVK